MRLGLIARCDQSGLANQTLEYHRHLNPAKTLVIDVGHLADDRKHCNKRSSPERFPHATAVNGWLIDRPTLKNFLSGIDVLLSAETFYTPDMAALAARYKVRTVLACNPEFLNRRDMPDLWIPPTKWMWDTVPDNKHLLPVPIPTDRFVQRTRPQTARHFLHIVGRPAVHDRNGTTDLLSALQHVESDIVLTLSCLDPHYLPDLCRRHTIPPNVRLRFQPPGAEDYWRNYDEGDVLVMPRRFGGLCLPVNEALGAGMPVIMTDISPQNGWLPPSWLVPASKQGSFMAKQRVEFFTADARRLAAKIDQFASDPAIFQQAVKGTAVLRNDLSWETLQPRYMEVLANA